MPKYRIDWKSCSQWSGTERTMEEGDELYDTREDAEAAMAGFEQDSDIQDQLWNAAVEDQGVEGWMEIAETDDE